MKKSLIALVVAGLAGPAFAQNSQMNNPGPTQAPPGSSNYGGSTIGTGVLPPSTTGTARPQALDSNTVSAAEQAARTKIEQAGFTGVKGLSRSSDGTWSGRAVRNGVEVAVVLDAAGNVMTQ